MALSCILKWLTLAATFLAIHPAQSLETLPGEPAVEGPVEPVIQRVVPPSDEPLASGRVVAVDRAAGRITLEFRPIPQLFLEGGTRIFRVEDPTSLKGLSPGDKVRFEVERNDRSYSVTRIENSN
jgi:Cu(I)/Ag(I) efflux system protein CusF